jgi:hypothetical protein
MSPKITKMAQKTKSMYLNKLTAKAPPAKSTKKFTLTKKAIKRPTAITHPLTEESSSVPRLNREHLNAFLLSKYQTTVEKEQEKEDNESDFYESISPREISPHDQAKVQPEVLAEVQSEEIQNEDEAVDNQAHEDYVT